MFRGKPEEIAALKVGSVLYNFDGNRRVYKKAPGAQYSSGGPIYEKHFAPATIVGETKVSWIMDLYDAKVNKKTLDSSTKFADRGYFTKSAMEADIWSHDHRHIIVREVERAGLEQLQEIARIVGYHPHS
jgi:uncharacterized protein (DUF488 family)